MKINRELKTANDTNKSLYHALSYDDGDDIVEQRDATLSVNTQRNNGVHRQISSSSSFTHLINAQQTPQQLQSVTVLLLSLTEPQKYELAQVRYTAADATTVRDLLHLLPHNAKDFALASQKYVGFCSPARGGRELINSFPLEVYGINDGRQQSRKEEILVAIPSGWDGVRCLQWAKPILERYNRRKQLEQNNHIPTKSPTPTKNRLKKRLLLRQLPLKKHQSIALLTFSILTALLLSRHHQNLIQPLGPGDTLTIDDRRSRCGLLDYLPRSLTRCRPLIMESLSDYVWGVYIEPQQSGRGRRRSLAYVIRGVPSQMAAPGGATGSPSLSVGWDNNVMIQGNNAIVEWVEGSHAPWEQWSLMTPWPFVTMPPRWKEAHEKRQRLQVVAKLVDNWV